MYTHISDNTTNGGALNSDSMGPDWPIWTRSRPPQNPPVYVLVGGHGVGDTAAVDGPDGVQGQLDDQPVHPRVLVDALDVVEDLREDHDVYHVLY